MNLKHLKFTRGRYRRIPGKEPAYQVGTDGKISRGDLWDGPHPGIAYILEAEGVDIRCEFQVSEIRFRRRKLSDVVGKVEAAKLARKIAAIKGDAGDVFYVNQHGAMFAPVRQDDGWNYLFIATLGAGEPWFSKTHQGVPQPHESAQAFTHKQSIGSHRAITALESALPLNDLQI